MKIIVLGVLGTSFLIASTSCRESAQEKLAKEILEEKAKAKGEMEAQKARWEAEKAESDKSRAEIEAKQAEWQAEQEAKQEAKRKAEEDVIAVLKASLPAVADTTSVVKEDQWEVADPADSLGSAKPGEFFRSSFGFMVVELEPVKPGRKLVGKLTDTGGHVTNKQITLILADGITNAQVGYILNYNSGMRLQKVSDEPLLIIDRSQHR